MQNVLSKLPEFTSAILWAKKNRFFFSLLFDYFSIFLLIKTDEKQVASQSTTYSQDDSLKCLVTSNRVEF